MKKGAKLPMNTAVAPNDNVHKCIKTAKLKNNESISGVRGRIGYVEQAIKSGDYKNIHTLMLDQIIVGTVMKLYLVVHLVV